jgi:cytochrome b subunit of formate dehydrogenase
MEQILIWSGLAFWLLVLLRILALAAGPLFRRMAHRLPPYPVMVATLGALPVMIRRAWRAHEVATTWQDRKGSPSQH